MISTPVIFYCHFQRQQNDTNSFAKKTSTTISSTIKEVLEMTVIQHILQAVFNFFLTLIYMTYISFSAALPINSIFTDFVGDICFHYTELGILRLAAASAA